MRQYDQASTVDLHIKAVRDESAAQSSEEPNLPTTGVAALSNMKYAAALRPFLRSQC